MTELEIDLLNALIELERTVATMPQANPKPNLLPLFSRLDALSHQLPPESDPTLRHYLQKKSYEKALFFLQGQDNRNQSGNCGHV